MWRVHLLLHWPPTVPTSLKAVMPSWLYPRRYSLQYLKLWNAEPSCRSRSFFIAASIFFFCHHGISSRKNLVSQSCFPLTCSLGLQLHASGHQWWQMKPMSSYHSTRHCWLLLISVSYTCWHWTILLPLKMIHVNNGVDNLEVALEGTLAFKR